MRELVRFGVIRSPHSFEHCYVASRQVRRVLRALGWEDGGTGTREHRWATSRGVHSFLVETLDKERATFHHDFDLPFLTIAEHPDLWARFALPDIDDDDPSEDA